ncbi:MAG: hypothetical protein CSA33_07155 [Desulfobulbus propionicus]|nr:MAG: hypothetical protein CSA33_07155 [Desulfobulbus propionicus]
MRKKSLWLVYAVLCAVLLTSLPVYCADLREKYTSLLEHLELYQHEKLTALKRHPENSLQPFTTDGCSGGMSVGWDYLANTIDRIKDIHGDQPPWEACCINHDRAYHAAGPKNSPPEKSFQNRKAADEQLRLCVLATGTTRSAVLSAAYHLSTEEVESIYQVIGDLMYHAVRLGGVPCTNLPWRWGYGWPECE